MAPQGGVQVEILCVLLFAGVFASKYSRHNLNNTGHTGNDTPRIADLLAAVRLTLISSLIFQLV